MLTLYASKFVKDILEILERISSTVCRTRKEHNNATKCAGNLVMFWSPLKCALTAQLHISVS